MDINKFFEQNNKVALAFSGGTDSAYLLYAAKQSGADITAYYVKSDFQPEFEYNDAIRLAKEMDAKLKVLTVDVLSDDVVISNPVNRCYYCKKRIFSAIMTAATSDGYEVIIDGTNASDDFGDRPGMKVLMEMSVKSPLRECGITKDEVRLRSKEAGLFTWDKPAYACLATRIKTGELITKDKLTKTEKAEEHMTLLGFSDFRVRMFGNTAKIQVKEGQFRLVTELREKIYNELIKYYDDVLLDLEAR